jgi:Fur family transcriptional regulator, stress-responsive regulator
MSELLERLRERGWRVTAQRRVVAEVLSGTNVHLTADEVLDRARALLPEISRATVYNTLTEMVALGEVHEVSTDERAKRYDPNPDHAHQHLICDGCGRIVDVSPRQDPLLTLDEDERSGFDIRRVDVNYRGLCPDCTAGGAPAR